MNGHGALINIGTKINPGLIQLLFMILCLGKLKGERGETVIKARHMDADNIYFYVHTRVGDVNAFL